MSFGGVVVDNGNLSSERPFFFFGVICRSATQPMSWDGSLVYISTLLQAGMVADL